MAGSNIASLTEHFGNLDDPRIDRTKRHELIDILTIALCGVITGADSWVDIEAFGRRKEGWLRKMLELPNGIPSHDTFGRVFAELDAEQFDRCFTEWVLAVSEVLQGEVVAIDGKTVRRSHDRYIGKDAIHMVSAWACASGVTLGQTGVDSRSNEITAIPRLLEIAPSWRMHRYDRRHGLPEGDCIEDPGGGGRLRAGGQGQPWAPARGAGRCLRPHPQLYPRRHRSRLPRDG